MNLGGIVNPSQIYIAASIVVLAVIAALFFLAKKNTKRKKLTPLAGLAFGFMLAGIIFGDDRLLGYSLMGVGVILAIFDMKTKMRSK
ncbi:Uncharacterised protein [uncultured archaeon]|nr:Uncharacterised protein [uncultured archaeon]